LLKERYRIGMGRWKKSRPRANRDLYFADMIIRKTLFLLKACLRQRFCSGTQMTLDNMNLNGCKAAYSWHCKCLPNVYLARDKIIRRSHTISDTCSSFGFATRVSLLPSWCPARVLFLQILSRYVHTFQAIAKKNYLSRIFYPSYVLACIFITRYGRHRFLKRAKSISRRNAPERNERAKEGLRRVSTQLSFHFARSTRTSLGWEYRREAGNAKYRRSIRRGQLLIIRD